MNRNPLFFNAKLLSLDARQENLKPISYARTLLHTDLINIFHPTPPSDDPLDYDPAEPNIRMEEITIETGVFRIKGKIRFGIRQDVYKYFRNTSERFTSIYDADIYSPSIPKIGVMRVPFVLVRKDQSLYMQK